MCALLGPPDYIVSSLRETRSNRGIWELSLVVGESSLLRGGREDLAFPWPAGRALDPQSKGRLRVGAVTRESPWGA